MPHLLLGYPKDRLLPFEDSMSMFFRDLRAPQGISRIEILNYQRMFYLCSYGQQKDRVIMPCKFQRRVLFQHARLGGFRAQELPPDSWRRERNHAGQMP